MRKRERIEGRGERETETECREKRKEERGKNSHSSSTSAHTLLAAVHKLSGIHSLSTNKRFLPQLVVIRVPEHNTCQGGPPAGVMNYISHDPLDIAMSLCVVQMPQLGSSLAVLDVSLEDAPFPLTLTANHTTHDLFQIEHMWLGKRCTHTIR